VIHDRIAVPLGLSIEAAAHGVVQIANANMSRAIRSVSVERGYDIGEFALCAFGGAGPLHAAEVAVECGFPQVLIPREPGTTCARGMLLTDLSSDFVRSYFADAGAASWSRILALFDEMEGEGNAWLDREGVTPERRRFKRMLDARYRGQNFEVKVPCDGLRSTDLGRVIGLFHEAHTLEYGYAIPERDVEFVSARLQAVGDVPKAPQTKIDGGASIVAAAIGGCRVFMDPKRGWREAIVYQRESLPVGVDFAGPAIVNEMSATTLILEGQTGAIDPFGNLIVRIA
jgi:N-methylhydantoinase A